MPTRTTRAITAALLGPLLLPLLLGACSRASAPRPSAISVRMNPCGDGPRTRPGLLSVLCPSDAITARSLTWSAWGSPVATAIGAAVVDLCAFEDCHTGAYGSFSIVLIASRIRTCPRGARAYSRLQYLFVGHSPFQDLPANLKFSNFMFGSGRPGLPQNQTVNLSC
jgi:hypothetical protein